MELNVKTTLEEGQVEMRRRHFNQAKGYAKAFEVTYVKIQELEDQIEEEEINDEEEHGKKKTKAVDKLEDDETTPIKELLMKGKEATEKPVTQKEHKDIAIGMEMEWIETKNQKVIYELVAPQVGSPTVAKQVSIKPCS
jgi:hypothetical protein